MQTTQQKADRCASALNQLVQSYRDDAMLYTAERIQSAVAPVLADQDSLARLYDIMIEAGGKSKAA